MRKSGFSETQSIGIVRQAEAGQTTPDVCRAYSMSRSTLWNWKAKLGGVELAKVRRPREQRRPQCGWCARLRYARW